MSLWNLNLMTFVRRSFIVLALAYILNNKFNVTELDWTLFHPERGHYSAQQLIESTSHRMFEGWYYKVASKELQLAIIPGAYHSMNEGGNYAFIMFVTAQFCYEYRYPLDHYEIDTGSVPTQQQFYVRIGANNFSRNAISLHLESKDLYSIQPSHFKNESGSIQIELTFLGQDAGFPVTLLQIGAMGYFGWIPFLECYHGILAMNYWVHGTIYHAGHTLYDSSHSDTQLARGYQEKDWGTNFPQTWIWIQANHFEKDENVSLTLALSRVPLIGDSWYSIPGFLGGLFLENRVYRMGTFMWSSVESVSVEDDEEHRTITVEIHSFWAKERLSVIATIPNLYSMSREEAMVKYPHLQVPQSDGYMRPTLMEWMNAKVWIRFEDDNRHIVFESESQPATVECHGDDNMEYILKEFNA